MEEPPAERPPAANAHAAYIEGGAGSPMGSLPPSHAPATNSAEEDPVPEGAGQAGGAPERGAEQSGGSGPSLMAPATSGMRKIPHTQTPTVERHGKTLHVTKRGGHVQPLKAFKLKQRINQLMEGLDKEFVSVDYVVDKVIKGSFDGVKSQELDALASETAAYLATEHPDYSLLAGRIAVSALHKVTPSSFSQTIKLLHEYVHKDTKSKCPKIADDVAAIVAANAAQLDACIDYGRDYTLDYFAFKTLEKAYLLRVDGVVVERPQSMFLRVALGIHKSDIDAALLTYWYMSNKFFTHATPTLFNAGTPHNQMSSCFLLQIKDDSIDGIYSTLRQCAKISSEAGGIGLSMHNVRARGSYMHTSHGSANGVVPMLRVFNATARFCDQGAGKRPGAFAMYLEPWHAEVYEFLEMKKNTGSEEHRARDLFYALWVPDLFMRRVEEDGMWSLFCPMEAPGLCDCYGQKFVELYEGYEKAGRARKTVKARDLWFSILDAQTENGIPYLLYKDACNEKSNQKNLGVIKCSNLCTEIVQYTSPDEIAVCNLASLCLPRFVTDQQFDHNLLNKAAQILVHNLNCIIDTNKYPLPEAKHSNLRHRPIGIGVQGLADVFQILHLPFDSDGARKLNKEIFETIYFAALTASNALAVKNGPYETFEGSPASQGVLQFDMWGVKPSQRWDWAALKEQIVATGLRNSLLVAPMPTASTAQIMGNNECFEPYTSNVYNRRVMAGDFPIINPHLLKDLTSLGLWNQDMKHRIMAADGSVQGISEIPSHVRALYKTAWELKQRVIIDMAADRGAFIDQSQSLNLFIEAPNMGKLTSMHFHAWKRGLKTGCYYLRTRPAADAIKFTVEHSKLVEVREARSAATTPKGGLRRQASVGSAECVEEPTRAFMLSEFQRRKAEARRAAEAGEPCLMCSS